MSSSDRRGWRARPIESAVSVEPGTLGYHVRQYLEALAIRNYSHQSIDLKERHLRYFVVWCEERGLLRPDEITVAVVERYQRSLHHSRKTNGKALTFRCQRDRLVSVRGFFRWLTRARIVEMSPAEMIELPRVEQRLPRAILSVAEVERILALPDIKTAKGLRDRAILETLYSTGLRRMEVCNLHLADIDLEAGTVIVRQGKGKKDRMIPIGSRAVAWIEKYLEEVRPNMVIDPDDGVLFLTKFREAFTPDRLSSLVRDYVDDAEIGKKGSCHLFRHTMATLMLEGGADIRFIQAMLGHASIESTEIYTQVAIRKLKEVYELTHPGAKLERQELAREQRSHEEAKQELLSSLAAEAADGE